MNSHKIRPELLAIILSDKCNAECDICCFSCSPRRDKHMPLESVLSIISEAAYFRDNSFPHLTKIGFSGGEPFLDFNDLLASIKCGAENGFRVSCVSNGFWATDYKRTKQMLGKCMQSGLKKLSLSCDVYHNKFVPIENIKNILLASKEFGLSVEIGSIINYSTSDLGYIYSELKELMVGVPHLVSSCLPAGAALQNIEKSDYIYDNNILNFPIYCHDLSYLSIQLDGSVFPCCSQIYLSDELKLGNINHDSFETLYKNYNSNLHIRILKKYGLSWYIDIADKLQYRDFSKEKFVSKCHICSEIFTDPDFMTLISDDLECLKREIYEKYLSTITK